MNNFIHKSSIKYNKIIEDLMNNFFENVSGVIDISIWECIVKIIVQDYFLEMKDNKKICLQSLITVNKYTSNFIIKRIKTFYIQFDRFALLRSILNKVAVYNVDVSKRTYTEIQDFIEYHQNYWNFFGNDFAGANVHNFFLSTTPYQMLYIPSTSPKLLAHLKIEPDIEIISSNPNPDPAHYMIQKVEDVKASMKSHNMRRTILAENPFLESNNTPRIKHKPIRDNKYFKERLEIMHKFLLNPLPTTFKKSYNNRGDVCAYNLVGDFTFTLLRVEDLSEKEIC